MEKIKTTDFSSYRVGESFEFNRIAAEVFSKCTNTMFTPFATKHQAQLNIFDDSLKKQTFTLESEQLSNLDGYRDNALLTIEMLVFRSVRCGIAAREEAAKRLDAIISRYGKLTTLPYMQQSGLTVNLLQDLSSAEAVADLSTIGAAMWADDLKKFNDDFVVQFNSRNEEAGIIASGATKEARMATETAYKACVQCLNTLILLEGVAPYADIVGTLNNLIDRQKTIIKTRKGK